MEASSAPSYRQKTARNSWENQVPASRNLSKAATPQKECTKTKKGRVRQDPPLSLTTPFYREIDADRISCCCRSCCCPRPEPCGRRRRSSPRAKPSEPCRLRRPSSPCRPSSSGTG